MKNWKRTFIILIFLFHSLCCIKCFSFLFSKPEEKARKYLKLSFEEYKNAIKINPNDTQLIEEYERLLKSYLGETEAKVELLLIFKEINLQPKINELLIEIVLNKKEEALKYIEKKIEKSKNISEKINLYSIATEISPQNPLYWFNLGKLLIGINRENEGIEALEKTYKLNFKDVYLFYYLALHSFNKGDYNNAKTYIKEGLEISDDISLHKILLKIYLSEGNKEMAYKEREKIKELIAYEKKRVKAEEEKLVRIPKEKIEGLNPYYFIGVSKEEQKLYIVKFDGYKFLPIKTYNCSTGQEKGDKEKEGDKKTPEGSYILTTKLEDPILPPKYGIAAFPLNFPNPIDKRLNKSGNGIWFHATPIERPPYNSEGCIVVNDKDMKEIMQYIEVGKTFINISADRSFLNFSDFKKIKETIDNWKMAWESKNIQNYIEFYDENFLSDGKNKKLWKSHKERINRNKTFIKVEIKDLQIIPYGKTKLGFLVIAFFIQEYSSNNFSSKTKKILYLVKRNNNWKIICEEVI
ncbi:MAG: L,D-transpeptidase family protein [Candidatus Omnitrophica bacterium]|nr:L,D-transpeptidase family protein [Candidatus Omnitrophota bacterium]MCM8807033.1 L,D-transpeptidase family protein [Candidatus Omnitrophota bacterium]